MNLVIDTSVAIKWFIAEELHDEAGALLDPRHDLFAPDFLIIELANVAWKKARREEIDRAQALEIAMALHDDGPVLVPSSTLIDRALGIALELDHPVYDCLYVACGETVDGVVVTADDRLYGKVGHTAYEPLVRHLGEP